MTIPYCIFQNNDLCPEASAEPAHGAPPPLISPEPLLPSVVRVTARAGRANAKEQASVCSFSAWNEEEKTRSLFALRPWIEGGSSSSLGAATTLRSPAASTVGVGGFCEDARGVLGARSREDSFTLDNALVETVVRGSLWQACRSGSGGRDTNQPGRVAEAGMLDMRRLHSRVHELRRALQQRREGSASAPKTSVAKSPGLRDVQERGTVSEEGATLDTRRVFAIMTGSAERDSVQHFCCGGTEPFLVGLVCREPSGGSTPRVVSVRPFATAGLTGLSDESGGGSVRGNLGTEAQADGPEEASFSVMLIEAEMGRLDAAEMQLSPVWQTLLSVVDFVYAAASPSAVACVASTINGVCCAAVATPGVRHFGVGCGARPAVPPSFFYSVVGEAPASMKQYTGRTHRVGDLHAVFVQLTQTQELRASPCCRGPLQWSMLLAHTWRLTKAAHGVAAASPLQQRMDAAVAAAADMFVATAEGVLLAMYAMEPLPPLSVRGDAIGAVTVLPRDFSLQDVLHTAHQVALLALDTDVASCVFDRSLTPRHAALEDAYCGCRYRTARDALNLACRLASDSLKERLCAFAVHAAAQALRQTSAGTVSVLSPAGGGGGAAAASLSAAIEDATRWIHHFRTAPLLSHYRAQDGGDAKQATVTAATGAGCSPRRSLPCRMVESPIIAAAVPNAKAAVLSEYVEQALLPALLGAARERESVLRAQELRASEAREALLLAEDNCLQLQQRWKRAEAQLEHQRGELQEAKRHSRVLHAQLHESCSCLQKLLQTCVGYEETHGRFMRRLRFQLRRGVATSEVTPVSDFTPEGPRQRETAMGVEALVQTPAKDAASALAAASIRELTGSLGIEGDGVNNDVPAAASSPSPRGQVELLNGLLRDAHQHLEASHNVLLCLYEDAQAALHQLNATSADGRSGGRRYDSCQSLLSASLQAARTTTPVRSLGQSVSDAASEAVSAGACECTSKGSAVGAPATPRHAVHREGSDQLAEMNNSARSSPSLGCGGIRCAPPNTDAASTDQLSLPRQPQQEGGEGKERRRSTPVSRWATAVSLLPTPDRGVTSAVEAIADLQRQRQGTAEALARLERQYAAVTRQLDERGAALVEAQREHEAEAERWGAERAALLRQLRAAAEEAHAAEEACKASQQEVRHWAQSWAELMAAAEAEAETTTLAGQAAACAPVVRDDDDADGGSKTGEDGRRPGGKRETTPICVTTADEALAAGRLRLCALVERVAATAREQARGEELQKQASVTATLRASEESARMAAEVTRLQEALAAAAAREGLLRLDRDRLALRKDETWRRLHRMEEAYVALLDVWEEAMVGRGALLLWQCGDIVTALCEKNEALSEQLRQSQAEVQHLAETLCGQAGIAQQRGEEVTRMRGQLERHRDAQSAAEKHVSQLLRRLDQLAAAYAMSCSTWEEAMARRCELLLEPWECCLHFDAPRPRCESPSGEVPLPQEAEAHDPCGLLHELQQKRRRIAALEEALRQSKVRGETLEEAVAQLNALLAAQREIGMAPPPSSPPRVSRDFGVLTASPTAATNAAPLVSSFYASPSRVGDAGGSDPHPLQALLARSPSAAEEAPAVSLAELQPLGPAGRVEDAGEPRPLSWYLQSLSAIESTLSPWRG
ncbi:uncharacterized protein Tco025E_01922 [Trypanosoma conorhini]|uniref:Uncharacterized protein n=1 Tax=Trypanosoma conorhini TaxID=83891 RepID=A0A3R7M3D4_9TRYP|nr:uncharacterized protein Tco025E_01922 [Trypanosoma conorhini]RNF25822.1 hypothetical protein Tco025E_01922 [Trypanosoma conorhini]